MTFALWLAFAATQTLFALTPGPAVLLVSSQAMAGGFRAGFAAALGVQAGNGVYFLLSVAGLGAVLAASETFFTGVKWAGAAYLVWMGVRTVLTARAAPPARPGDTPVWSRPFVQGLVKQLANPKSVLFFGSLLPQFVTPGRTTLADLLLLGATCAVIEIPILAAYAAVSARGGALFARPGQIVWRERLSGVALIAVGGLLATMRRGHP